MKSLFLISIAILCAMVQAHMGMTLAAVPPREKLAKGDDYRAPHGTKICQGIPKIEVQKTVAAGDVIEGKMSGGAAHGGGHCSMIVSVDEKTWYKIGDYKDCTTKGSLQFTMPKGVPRECSGDAGCTFGWLWTPIFSGTCEIYMNCYHLKVTGAMGGIEKAQNRKLELPIGNCVRPNTQTRYTTMFGYIIGPNAPDPYQEGDNQPVTQAPGQPPAAPTTPLNNAPITILPDNESPTCKPGQLLMSTGLPKTHTVGVPDCGYKSELGDAQQRAADERTKCTTSLSLGTISSLYDLQCAGEGCNNWDVIFNLNKCTDASLTHSCQGSPPTCMAGTADQICHSQVLKLPQSECGDSPCGVHGDWSVRLQKCLCEPEYIGAQCQTLRSDGGGGGGDNGGGNGGGNGGDSAVDAGSVAASFAHGVVLCLGVASSLVV